MEKQKPSIVILSEILGLEDLFSPTVWRASVAELVGTAALVFTLDTIVISTIQMETKTPNLILSVLAAIIITILILATFPISGGHINPLASLKAVVDGEIEKTFSLGGCTLTVVAPGPNGPTVTGLETGQALWLEIICGFVFLFASGWMAFDQRQAKALSRVNVFIIVGIVLGLLVFISTSVTATKGYAGAGLNPARCLGPAIVRGGASLGWSLGILGWACYCLCGIRSLHKANPTSAFLHNIID
ncbi:hypothetical protein OIU77_029057 [Salix suchowensis]|uniref:Uncharacterized protein n=1 Tax=Salix suchowensis TaxID=1278906 RepID=A0ABQ9BJL0_9ROSI|nr:hypothetical protein OIU77_029057 [Salix suchowensis]